MVSVRLDQFDSRYAVAFAIWRYQSGMSLEFDGKPGVGWLELSWPKAYIDYMSTREKYPSASEKRVDIWLCSCVIANSAASAS